MRAMGRAPSRCDITLLTPPPFFFPFYPRHFTKRERWGGEQKIRRPLRLLLLLQCYSLYYYYYYMYNKQAFFHISILSTDLISDGERQLLRDYELQRGYGLGVVGGGEVGGGCRTFASWHFLHFFMDCFVFFGYKERDGRGDSRTCL